MAGHGRLDEVSALRDPRIFMFRNGHWINAEEPLHTDKPKIAGVGLAMNFAKELL
ncbi:MAG: sialate O-acetylesterase [Verrucomicrobiota bacterium]